VLIKDMVQIYSPTGSEGELVEYLVDWANTHGFSAFKDDAGNFVAERGVGREILLVGHVDTVPGRIPVRVDGDCLYGRGSVDAKGALACFLEAASVIENGRIIIVGTVYEEGDSRGAKHILDKFDPAFIIVGEPSGWSNVNIGYKGCLNLIYRNSMKKVHSSITQSNSCEEAICFYNKLREYSHIFNKEKTLFQQLGMKLISINSANDPNIENIEMVLKIRTPQNFDIRAIKDFVAKEIGDATIEYSGHEKAVKAEKRNSLVTAFIKAIRSLGGDMKFKLKTGTSDMNILQDYHVPIVTYGPGDSTLDHTPNEHLDLLEYRKSVQVLENVLSAI